MTAPQTRASPRASRPSATAAVRSTTARRAADLGPTLTAFYVIVVVVAGASALALLVWPSHSGSFFSWDLGAAPAAAMVGGLYLASVATFGAALMRPRPQTRSLNTGILALALPTLWFTSRHATVFDWSRPQAVAWVVLFLSAPISIIGDLRTPTGPDDSPKATHATQAALLAVAMAATALAAALWIEPIRADLAARSPVPLVGLTGRYLGAWCAFVAVSAATAVVRGRTSDAGLVAVLLGSVSCSSLLAMVRTSDDLGPNAAMVSSLWVGVGMVSLVLHLHNRAPRAPGIRDGAASCTDIPDQREDSS